MNGRGQTKRQVQELLFSSGIRPSRSLGQCFLVDLNLLQILVDQAELEKRDLVLEVGTGTGSLTNLLAARAGAVVSVEIDRRLHELAREVLKDRDNVVLLCCDALLTKHRIHPLVRKALDEAEQRFGTDRRKLVANLPYNIATPLIINLLYEGPHWERMVATIQLELAEKMAADVDHPEYGAVSVLVQALAEVTIARRLSPSVFWPRPKVHSAIVIIRPQKERYEQVGDLERFPTFVHRLWAGRRRKLAKTLREQLRVERPRELAIAAGLSPDTRVEKLTVDQFVRLFREVTRQ